MDNLSKKIKVRTPTFGERENHWGEWRNLKKELKERESKAIVDVLDGSSVVLATCTGAGDKVLLNRRFDVVVIDEAGQALEAACWIPLLLGKRAVLAGDHLQLPPTIHSFEAAKKGLEITLFERIMKMFGEKVSRLLNLQYRMNEKIMDWSSKALYDSKIFAHPDVKDRVMTDFPNIQKTEETSSPLVLIDTQGCDMDDFKDAEGSTSNEGEAHVIAKYIAELISLGVTENQIAVITPYYAQVKLLRTVIHCTLPNIKVNTVDGFQGREKEIVIISMVRSNKDKEIGFLAEKRRMNVAVTRARRHCVIVCNAEFVSCNKFLKEMVNYFENNGVYLSAASFTSEKVSDFSNHVSTKINGKPTLPTTQINNKIDDTYTPQQKLFVTQLNQLLEKSKKINSSQLNDEEKLKYCVHFNNPLSLINLEFLKEQSTQLNLSFQPYTEKNCQKAYVYYFAESITYLENKKSELKKEVKIESQKSENRAVETKAKSNNNNNNMKPANTNNNNKTNTNNNNNKSSTSNKSGTKKAGGPQVSDCPEMVKKREQFNKMTGDEALNTIYQARIERKCYYPNCKILIHEHGLLATQCEFCKEKFCLSHGSPFNHGCSTAARLKAHSDFKASYDSNGQKKPTMTAEKQTDLQNKMKKKLEEQSASRARKAPEKGKDDKKGKK
jgi:predicted nucleic acid binding AN1-type Zn finger protein